MKRITAFLMSILLFIGIFAGYSPAKAANDYWLPFELTAPEHVSITYLDGNDSANTCQVAWSQNDSMSAWLDRMEDPDKHDAAIEEFESHGYSDLWITTQMDWSVDNQTDWHYNKYWDTEGYDENWTMRLGEWAYTKFDTVPVQGDSFRYHDLVITAYKMDGARILTLKIVKDPEPAEGGQKS